MTNASQLKKPSPVKQPWTEEFWKGTKQHKFLIQHCDDCGKNIFYPRKVCPECRSSNLSWIESKGKGTLFSYTITHYGVEQRFASELPYVLCMVDMDEGIRVFSRIVNCRHEDIKCDISVEVVFEEIDGDPEPFTIFYFQPARK